MRNLNRIINIPLFWKFAIISTIVIIIYGSINIYLLWTSVYSSFEKEIDKRCKVLGKIVSDKALTPIVYDDILSLHNILDEIKQSDPSISYIFILNNSNELIAHSYDVNISESLISINSLSLKEYNIRVIETSNFKHPVIRDIAYPILDGEIGTVRIGIVEEHIRQEMMEATRNVLTMIIAFFVFGLSGAFVFSYIITSPIKKISQKAQTIDLNYIDSEDYNINLQKKVMPFKVQINDELDVLETKFSEMLNRLKTSYTEIKETQDALVQAEKMASLGTLSAGIAHEINNPISGIKNCISRIIKKPDNTEQNTRYILLIKEAINKIENVVQHLLNFSRKQDILLKKTNLGLVVQSAIILTEYKAQSNKINIKANTSAACFVNASPNHLEQVFVNLILNGIDAIIEQKANDPDYAGEIKIVINKHPEIIRLSFFDNGIGITADKKDKIFDPFFTSKKVGKGTGLGLSVSFNLINEHGGKIYFKSTERLGTEFVVELPCYSK